MKSQKASRKPKSTLSVKRHLYQMHRLLDQQAQAAEKIYWDKWGGMQKDGISSIEYRVFKEIWIRRNQVEVILNDLYGEDEHEKKARSKRIRKPHASR